MTNLHLPLAGATVIITRPTLTADASVRTARRLGALVVRLPGLGLRATEDRATAAAGLRRARKADAWIFTSPAAVHFAFALAPELRPSRATRVFAVGAGTARALGRHGIGAIHPSHCHDSDGLLALDILAAPHGWQIAVIDAPGGRDAIAPTLRERGAAVERLHVYRRTAPRLDRRHFARLAAAPLPWISLVSSGEALGHLAAALPAALASRWRGQALVVSSRRLATQALELGFGDVHVARSALPTDLFGCAGMVLARHRI
ncbi:MAG TPA: uroporphyrinogen-III synthase [Dokdonella sp.]|uniref:uroporphyrinogen-III synthase n=1 Tax=Dokdonella sp. TaxID=2291710 RepID=UPI0025BE1E98|nr:uroporphyrinogen-III synthase [Dokdonella sp.]MBX3691409.1 uroporphyrinogen-III synthase [Dokdonella sp.]MCW5567866.1 uroporphyrinogen-III synthase [Dokdonella sp.]HNR91966.1 uroporphyrinogen-III synthase [Dokdonella sp.]